MPIFKRAEAIASIAKKTLNNSYAFFESDKLNVHCLGKITFDGRYDMTVGTKVLGGGFLKRIMLPHVLGFNMLRDVIELHITGKWPKLKHSAKVEPLAWFHELFGLGRRPREANYNLDKIWTQI